MRVLDGMALFRCKAEEPVSRGIGRDVRLIDAADRERGNDALVGALHGVGVLCVEGALVLIDHDAVFAQRLVAAAIELLGEKSLAGAEGVGGVDDDEVVGVLGMAHEFQPVLVVDGDARVAEAARRLRQVFAADLDDELVDLDEVDMADAGIAHELAHGTAVAATDDEYVAYVRVDAERHVGDHLVVDELVFFREHHVAVEREEAAEFLGVEDIDALEFTAARVELTVDLDGEFDVRRVELAEPEFHGIPPSLWMSVGKGFVCCARALYFMTLSVARLMSSVPVIWQPFFFA